MGTRKNFFEIYRQFGLVLSKLLSSPVLHKATTVIRIQKLDYTAIRERPDYLRGQIRQTYWLLFVGCQAAGSTPHTFQRGISRMTFNWNEEHLQQITAGHGRSSQFPSEELDWPAVNTQTPHAEASVRQQALQVSCNKSSYPVKAETLPYVQQPLKAWSFFLRTTRCNIKKFYMVLALRWVLCSSVALPYAGTFLTTNGRTHFALQPHQQHMINIPPVCGYQPEHPCPPTAVLLC
jgi:hypothetical protein